MATHTEKFTGWRALLAGLTAELETPTELVEARSEDSGLLRIAAYGSRAKGGNGMQEWQARPAHYEGPLTSGPVLLGMCRDNLQAMADPSGCPPARKRVRALLKNLQRPTGRPLTTRRRLQWDSEARGELSSDRLYGGRADAPFRAPGRRQVPAAPRVRIAVAVGGSYVTGTEDIAKPGAMAAALASELYTAGFRVSVDLYTRIEVTEQCEPEGHANCNDYIDFICPIIREGERVDIDSIGDVLASGSTFRVALLCLMVMHHGADNGRVKLQKSIKGYDICISHHGARDPKAWLEGKRLELGLIK